MDHFDGSTLAQYASSSVSYVPGFSGLGQAISVPSGGWLRETFTPWFDWENPQSPQGTIELWVDPQSYNVPILSMQWYQANSPPSAGYILGMSIDPNGRLTVGGWNNTNPNNPWANPFPTGNTTIPLNTWTHIAFTWSPQGSYTYIDGAVDASSPQDYYPGFWPDAIPTEYIYLNNWGSSGFGQMDELRLSDVARTQFSTIIFGSSGGAGGLQNGVNGNIVGAKPLLAPLGNYGGPTETMPPLPGSPAIDAGSNALIPSGISTDQRGEPRIVNGCVEHRRGGEPGLHAHAGQR